MMIIIIYEFFSGFLFATAKIAYITAMIFIRVILHSPVHIHDFHIFITLKNTTLRKLHKGTKALRPMGSNAFLPTCRNDMPVFHRYYLLPLVALKIQNLSRPNKRNLKNRSKYHGVRKLLM